MNDLTTANAILGLQEMLATCAELSTCPAISGQVQALQLVINRHLIRYEDEFRIVTFRDQRLYRRWTRWIAWMSERFEMEDLY